MHKTTSGQQYLSNYRIDSECIYQDHSKETIPNMGGFFETPIDECGCFNDNCYHSNKYR